MKRRTRHALILLGIRTLLVLALGGWIVDAIRRPLTLRERVAAHRERATHRPEAAPDNETHSA
jgi:hypothetical protein